MSRLGSLGLRARLMLVVVTGLVLALVVGSVVLYRVLVYAVDRTLDGEALASAAEVAAMVDADRVPALLPVSGAQLIQVVDGLDRVVAASASADRLVSLLRPDELARARTGSAVLVDGARAGLSGPLRVRAVPAGPGPRAASVLVALPYGDVLTSRAALSRALLVVVPLLVAVLAAIAWRVIGSTLRPVEELRLGAERIGGRDREERLPVPSSADEVRALALTLNGMLDRLAAARTRQQAFVADAAHELRSPLASIRTQLEVAEHLGEGGSLPADLATDLARLGTLIEDLLLLARADADRRSPAAAEVVSADELVAALAGDFRSARVPVGVTPATGVTTVRAAPEELRRALANLVDNAVRHARSQVRLSVAAVAATVVLEVVDDGPGIAAADRERVFDRFTRLDEARDRDAGGTGLGLAIVAGLVSRAGGTVALLDGDGPPDEPGLRARVVLPATDPAGGKSLSPAGGRP